jgi:hypothetical protein
MVRSAGPATQPAGGAGLEFRTAAQRNVDGMPEHFGRQTVTLKPALKDGPAAPNCPP